MATAKKTVTAVAKKARRVPRRTPGAKAGSRAASAAAAVAKTALIPASKARKPAPPKPAKKIKLVRDSFTIPKTEYAAIDALKLRATGFGANTKKSELLRAGLMALAAMGDEAFRFALGNVPAIKTGRPKGPKTS